MNDREKRERYGEPQGATPKTLRTLKPGMSLKALSRKSGIKLPHLSRVVNGRRGLTVAIARRIAKATGTTIDRVVRVLQPV